MEDKENQATLTIEEIKQNMLNSADILPTEKVELLCCSKEELIPTIKKIAERWALRTLESEYSNPLRAGKDLNSEGI